MALESSYALRASQELLRRGTRNIRAGKHSEYNYIFQTLGSEEGTGRESMERRGFRSRRI